MWTTLEKASAILTLNIGAVGVYKYGEQQTDATLVERKSAILPRLKKIVFVK